MRRPTVDTGSDHLFGLVVGLAIAAHRRRPGASIELRQPRRDLRVFALEQRIAGKIALHQKRAEILDFEDPYGLGEPQLVQPINSGYPLEAPPEKRTGAVAYRGEIDRMMRHERFPVDFGCHSPLADDDAAARQVELAAERLGKAERGG